MEQPRGRAALSERQQVQILAPAAEQQVLPVQAGCLNYAARPRGTPKKAYLYAIRLHGRPANYNASWISSSTIVSSSPPENSAFGRSIAVVMP